MTTEPLPTHLLEMKGTRSNVRHIFNLSGRVDLESASAPLSCCSLIRSTGAELVTTGDTTRPCKRCSDVVRRRWWRLARFDQPALPVAQPALVQEITAQLRTINETITEIGLVIQRLRRRRAEDDGTA